MCEGARTLRSRSICVLVLLACGWLAQAIDARAMEPETRWVKMGTGYGVKIGMHGKCHDSSCSGGGGHTANDIKAGGLGLVVMLRIQPSDSDALFSLPFLVGEAFIPPVSGQVQIQVELTEEVKRKIKEHAQDDRKCDDFEAEQLFVTSVEPLGTQP